MKIIGKYKIPPSILTDNIASVTMPKGTEILTVSLQHNKIVVWALIDVDAAHNTEFKFQSFLAGERVPEPEGCTRKYITTVFPGDERYPLHIFLCV